MHSVVCKRYRNRIFHISASHEQLLLPFSTMRWCSTFLQRFFALPTSFVRIPSGCHIVLHLTKDYRMKLNRLTEYTVPFYRCAYYYCYCMVRRWEDGTSAHNIAHCFSTDILGLFCIATCNILHVRFSVFLFLLRTVELHVEVGRRRREK